MKRSLIRELPQRVGQEVRIAGWVKSTRDQKSMQFVVVRDHTGLVQVALQRSEQNQDLNSAISSLTPESAVEVTGKVVEEPRVKLGGIELQLANLRVVNVASQPLPIDLSRWTTSNLDKRLDWRFLDLRLPENLLIFRVQTTVEMALREYLVKQGFIEIHSPKFMGTASESGAELFKVEYFGRTAYLAQSPQFYKQMAMAAGFDRVFEIGPVFRANPSFTARHDTEFTSIDLEMSWIETHDDVMQFEESWLQYALDAVRTRHAEEIKASLGVDLSVPSVPFPRISLHDALAIVGEPGQVKDKGDLNPQGEKLLSGYVKAKYDHEFVFVTDYPWTVRPFYHMRCSINRQITKSFDLLWRGLEITTGAQREHRYDVLNSQVLEKGLSIEPLQDYLNFFKYGCPPHAGFGFGLTRMLMIMLQFSNVREVTFLPRDPNRLNP